MIEFDYIDISTNTKCPLFVIGIKGIKKVKINKFVWFPFSRSVGLFKPGTENSWIAIWTEEDLCRLDGESYY